MYVIFKPTQLLFILTILFMPVIHAGIINVKDFGAVGDGVANDLPAFNAALDALRKPSRIPNTLLIPDGNYRLGLAEDPEAKAHLHIEDMKNLIITGETASHLIFASPYHQGILIHRSKNITVRNLTMDYDPLPFTQGIVTAVGIEENMIEVKIEDGYDAPTEKHLDFTKATGKNVGYVFDPETGRKLNQYFDQYLRKPVQDMGEGVFRYNSDNDVSEEFIGKRFAVIGRRKANAIKVDGSDGCLIENIAVYSAPACGYNVSGSSNVTIDRCAIKQKPGTTRVMSTNADGLHSKWCSVGPTLSNSYFTGMGDDSVNIGGSYTPIIDQIDDYTIVVETHGSITSAPADIVSFNRETHDHFGLGPVKTIHATKVEGYDRGCLEITFEQKLPSFVTWKTTQHKRKADQILNLNTCGKGSKILNNHFYSHRVRGVLMRGPDSIIRGNHFDTLAGPAIVVSNDGGFLSEGPSGNGTIIANNRFTNIERSNIWINSSVGDQSTIATKGVTGVKILDNIFENYGGENIYGRGEVGNVLFIKNASDLIIKGNRIGTARTEGTPVILNATGSIAWEKNTILNRDLEQSKDFSVAQE